MKQSYKIKIMHILRKFFAEEGLLKTIFESLCTIVIFAVIMIVFLNKEFDIWQVMQFDIAITISVTMIIAGALRFAANKIEHRLEDSTKLTVDYDSLIKLYNCKDSSLREAVISCVYPIQGEVVSLLERYSSCTLDGADTVNEIRYFFPVVKLFENKERLDFEIQDSQEMYQLPDLVLHNYSRLFEFHAHSNVYNNLNIRLKDCLWNKENRSVTLITERTTYFNSLVTNRALDAPLGEHLTIRSVFQVGKGVVPLSESVFSNHLGFNGFVATQDGYLVFVVRGSNMSVAKNTLGPSVGASMKTKYALMDKKFTLHGLENAICSEIKDELELERDTYSYSNGENIIAGYRDLVEGGKPQLLFFVQSTLNRQHILENFRQGRSSRSKKGKQSKEEQMRRDGEQLLFIPRDELAEVLIAPDCLIWRKKCYTLVPSTAASLVMVREYLRERSMSGR